MKINHAILHILDFDSAINVMSQRELDIESRTVRNFVTTHLRRARTSADNKRARLPRTLRLAASSRAISLASASS